MKQRYVLGIDFYIYAENDIEARRQAAKIVEEMEREQDNQPQVQYIVYQPWGKFESKEIYRRK
jgi:hypothetical protein